MEIRAKGEDILSRKIMIPARPYIGFGLKDEQAAMDALEDWLEIESINE